ncbi:unnamed protein product [[Actinomadura] parvosata subsp. kistnae]|nr:unnamed protein product [Actinomadura parvosata subsp. kistnae]
MDPGPAVHLGRILPAEQINTHETTLRAVQARKTHRQAQARQAQFVHPIPIPDKKGARGAGFRR